MEDLNHEFSNLNEICEVLKDLARVYYFLRGYHDQIEKMILVIKCWTLDCRLVYLISGTYIYR